MPKVIPIYIITSHIETNEIEMHGSGIIGDNIDKYQKFHAYRELLKCFDKKLNTKRT